MNVALIKGSSSSSVNSASQQTQQSLPRSTATAHSLKTAEINEFFKGPKIFESVLGESKKFNTLLANMGDLPMNDRDNAITRNLNAMVQANQDFVQNPEYLAKMTKIMRNVPNNTATFNTLVNSSLMKMRESLIKNRGSLNLCAPQWGEYSQNIREFCNIISANLRADFFKSLDQELLDFVLGKHGAKSKPDLKATARQIREKQKRKPLFFEKDDPEANSVRAEEILKDLLGDDYQENDLADLVSEMFSQVGRLEPELVSAVVIALVKNLPYGRLFFNKVEDAIDWLYAI